MSDGIRRKDLVPGRRYRIELRDCCIEGEIHSATFVKLERDAGSEAVFDIVRFDRTLACSFYEISEVATDESGSATSHLKIGES